MSGLFCLRAGARVVLLTLMGTAAGCGSTDMGGGGTGGPGTGGGGKGGMGGGGTGGRVSSLSLELQASTTDLDPGDVTELTWTVANATSCEASGGWSGEKSADSAAQDVPVFRDTTYTLSCADGARDEVSKSVTVIVSGRLMATGSQPQPSARRGARASALLRCRSSRAPARHSLATRSATPCTTRMRPTSRLKM
jgi:hypothetical protein